MVTEKNIKKDDRATISAKYHRSAPTYRELAIYDGKAREDTSNLAIFIKGDCEQITGDKAEKKRISIKMPLILAEKPNGGHYMPFAHVLEKDESAGRLYGMMVSCIIAGHFNLRTSYANHGFVPVMSQPTDDEKLAFQYQVDPSQSTNEILFYTDSPEIEKETSRPVIKMRIGETTLYILRLPIEEAATIVGPKTMNREKLIEFLRAQLLIKEDLSYHTRKNHKTEFVM